MEINEYITRKKELYQYILEYIDNENDQENNLERIAKYLNKEKIYFTNMHEMRSILRLISKISKHHHRNPRFFEKIQRILTYLFSNIQQKLANFDIFNLFKSNIQILLFLIQSSVIKIDQEIINFLYSKFESNFPNAKSKYTYYLIYLYPEIKPIIDQSKLQSIKQKINTLGYNLSSTFHENQSFFDETEFSEINEKRKQGENDTFICELIRNDSIIEFISYINKNNYSLSSRIKPSIFETNMFLIKNNEPSLIEYAAFYGSIQIFQYLKMNGINFTSSLWMYVIHSNNAELIHILEENHVKSSDLTFKDCFEESIKCHHNDLACYIRDNLYTAKDDSIDKFQIFTPIKYYNYFLLSYDDNINFYYFELFCEYDYFEIVKILLESIKSEHYFPTIS